MSQPFTSPTGATWQTLLDEITLAYSERRQALGQSEYIPELRDVQSSAYWRMLQGWLESNCTSFIDHINGPLTADKAAFLYFTEETWRQAAGLNANGFTRKHGPRGALTTSYGQMQQEDAIGGWVFEELQRGFSMLRWFPFFCDINNVRRAFPSVTGRASYYGSGSGTDFGVWYPLFGTRLGGSGTYNIVLDERNLKGLGGLYYISLGHSTGEWLGSGHGGGIILDTGIGEGILNYSAKLTFKDSTVQVFGCRNTRYGNAISSHVSFSSNSVSVSARLDTTDQQFATFEFFPVIKVPFTNI